MHLGAITSKQKKIFDKLKNFPKYYLAGGTALALQIGHRISVDFDFFSKKEIPSQLLQKVKKIFQNSKIKIIINNKEQLTLEVNKVNLTFLYYPFPLIFKLKKYKNVNLLSILEIAACKTYALGRRATYKDYVDLYFILKKKHAILKKIINISQKKYKQEFDPRLFLEQLLYLEDIKDIKIEFLKNKITKQAIQRFFEKQVSKYEI